MAVYNFGSINIDHVYKVPHFVTPGETLSSTHYEKILGGKGANQSVACAKAGLTTFHVGSIHQNDEAMLEVMQRANVDLSLVNRQSQTASGHAIIQVNKEGENAIFLYGGANHLLSQERIESILDKAKKDDWVLLQNETNCVQDIIDIAYDKGINIAFNPAPMTDNIANIDLSKLSLLIVNEVEAMQLSQTDNIEAAKDVLKDLSEKTQVVLTLGKQGAIFLSSSAASNAQIQVSAFKVEAVDTTAAGDTFIGFFLAQYIAYLSATADDANKDTFAVKPIENALKHACAASAISVTRNGAAPSVPSMEEVQDFLSKT
uniref:ribokinase n=1 Tax=Ningiella ruwaisensis TaxID=2364274 RepID=UPI00109FABF9|nr:ribokinase [Ningiella ruwaisensis]